MNSGLSDMYELLSAAQMNEADKRTIASGFSGLQLMQAAGTAVAEAATGLLAQQQVKENHIVVIIAGPGNNGGDGAIAAHKLHSQLMTLVLVRFRYDLCTQADALAAYQTCDETGLLTVDVNHECSSLADTIKSRILSADLIIDALFGAGLSRPITGVAAELVNTMNQNPAPTLSVDLPSGLDGNADKAQGSIVVNATHTVTFFRFKPAHFLQPGKALCGQLELAQIGIDDEVLEAIKPSSCLNAPYLWKHRLPKPDASDHKFTRGSVLVRGGGPTSSGASRLSAQACLNAGAGLVTLASPGDAIAIQASHLSAVMLKRCDSVEHWKSLLDDPRITAYLIGPANGVDDSTRLCVESCLHRSTPCVLDADALSAFQQDPQRLIQALQGHSASAVLTPHAGEFSRVFGEFVDGALSKRRQAVAAAQISRAVVVYKGNDTVVASPDGRSCINANAPPWLATAGSGDVLAGVTAALLGQGMAAFDAACAAVWIHGDAAANLRFPMTSEELIPAVSEAMSNLVLARKPSRPIGLSQ